MAKIQNLCNCVGAVIYIYCFRRQNPLARQIDICDVGVFALSLGYSLELLKNQANEFI